MRIAIASGKGGTGKTTIATNLAVSIAGMHEQVQYLDCDVEEPNGHIFLNPDIENTYSAAVDVPEVDLNRCTGCGKCDRLCQYSAIICLKSQAMVFEQLCHSCGGCKLVCAAGAITYKHREIGSVETGSANGVGFVHGKLNIGDIHTPPLIKQVKARAVSDGIVIVDAPPGTSCPVIEAVKDADFVLLVTEPTPFGLNDLKLAVEMIRQLGMPFAVVINRADPDEKMTHEYCRTEDIDIIFEVPDDRRIAEAYSIGRIMVDVLPDYRKSFIDLYKDISRRIAG